MKKKIAQLVSVAGHPLLTIPLYAAFVLFTFEDVKTASFNSALIIGCIFIPLILRLYLKSRNGSYTNFDVSDRKQRKSMFFFYYSPTEHCNSCCVFNRPVQKSLLKPVICINSRCYFSTCKFIY